MSRLIFLFAIAALVYMLFKLYRSPGKTEKPSVKAPEDMVRCARCGVHLPVSECVKMGDQVYCSEAHAHQK
jgi:uncharacterized protein